MRHLKATLLMGTISAAITVTLFAIGWISSFPDYFLQTIYKLNHPAVVSAGDHLLLIALLCYAITWTTVDITRPGLKLLVALASIILFITASKVMRLFNVFFSPVPADFAILISYLIALGYGRSASGSRKRLVEKLFGQRVSRSIFNQLVNAQTSIHFPGAQQEGTIIVCEVQNQKELMELLTPENYAAMTNLYLQTASDYLVEVGGYLDECSGESLKVVFGAPLPDEQHAARACRAALDLMKRLDNLNRECDATWQRRFDFRIGVNSGEIVTGAYGGSRLASFSISGPAVEFARRLSAACSSYGCRILVGPETYEQAAEAFEARPIDVIKGVGERRRIELYEILAPKHGLSPERERSRDHFWRGVIYYREKQWAKAIEEFSKARITGIPDAALDLFLQRVERSRRGEEEPIKEQLSQFATV